MGKKEKLLERLLTIPKDFTFDELKSLLEAIGFEMLNMGKTSGSRVRFVKGNCCIIMHKPHPRRELLVYQLKQILEVLQEEKLI